MTSEKRLLRSRKALIGGVCAGVADYFNVDPVIVRIIMVVFTLASGGLLGIAYILLWIVLPLEPKEEAPLDVHPQSGAFRDVRDVRIRRHPAQNRVGGAKCAQSRASGRLALCASPVRLGRSCAARAPGRRIARLCRCACRCFSFVCASGEPFA